MFIRLDVAQLSREQLLQLVRDYNRFEVEGAIGDCYLRDFAKSLLELNGFKINITRVMQDIAFEVFRRIAMENIRSELGE